MKKLTDDEVLSECRYQSAQASGSEFAADELVRDRTEALKYYYGKRRGDEKEGRSTIISKDVADMTDAMMTQIMPTFTQDNIVQFEPNGPDDEQQAKIESNFCNYQIMEKNNGFILLETLVKDALMSKNCTAKIIVEVTDDVKKEQYKSLSDEEMGALIIPRAPNEIIDVTSIDEEAGDVNLTRTISTRKLIVSAVAPENFSVIASHQSQYLEDVVYCVERLYKTKSELIEMGFSKKLVADLATANADTKADSIERNTISDEDSFGNRSESMQVVELEEHYIRIDQDGDGIAELHKVLSSGNTLLSNEEVELVPYANGIAFLNGHRYYGQSVYDKIKEIQDMKTHFLRQWADNALLGNHKKYVAVSDQVNMDDLTNGRPNGIIRAKNLNAVQELVTQDIGPSCLMALNYYDKVRTDRSGSALDLQSNQMVMPSNVGNQGVNTLIANLEQVTALVTRNISETLIASMYKICHKYLRLYFPDEINAKFGGQWKSTRPAIWTDREQVNITVPPTKSERVLQQIAIEKMILQSANDLAQGKTGITTDETMIYQLRLDHARMSGIDNPEKYLIDPSSPESKQQAQLNAQIAQQQQQFAMQQQQVAQLKQEELQNQMIQTQIAEIKRNWENDKEQLQFDQMELNMKIAMDKYKVDLKAEMDEAKLVGEVSTKLEVESIKAAVKLAGTTTATVIEDEDNETE